MSISVADRINAHLAVSFIGRWFQLEGSGHPKERLGSRFLTELRAGITTWAAMAYIISVNAFIISDSGGPCVCTADDLCKNDEPYLECVAETRLDLITSTAAISALSSVLMGVMSNLPVGMAPGLGLNAYFAYAVVGFHGSGKITYQEALAAVFLEGWIFLFLSIIGFRQWTVRIMPRSLVLAIGSGIGLFIAFIGLSSGGLGVIGGDTNHFIGLGGCESLNWISPDLPNFCRTGVLRSPRMWIGIFLGGFFTVFLMMYRIRGAILVGIFLTSIISWPRSTPITFFPYTPVGDSAFAYFKQVVAWHPLTKVGNILEFDYGNRHVWSALITFLYVDILDTTGTLYSMAKFAGLCDPVTLDFQGSTAAYCVDAFCISMGALLGTSPVTAYIESATGISEGGKTGLTGVFTGLMFFISIFFAPIFASIPNYATGGALVITGSLMVANIREINWKYMGDALPAFLTVIIIPLTYNVAYGIIAGVGSYVLLNGVSFLIAKLSCGRIVPRNYAAADDWALPVSGLMPPWLKRYRHRHETSIPLQTRGPAPTMTPSSSLGKLESPTSEFGPSIHKSPSSIGA